MCASFEPAALLWFGGKKDGSKKYTGNILSLCLSHCDGKESRITEHTLPRPRGLFRNPLFGIQLAFSCHWAGP